MRAYLIGGAVGAVIALGSHERAEKWRDRAGMPYSLVAFDKNLLRGN